MALEPINCTTKSREIEEVYSKVVRGNSDTTWLIIGPNANKEYGPEETGNDFSEFLHSFDDSKVQFGLARVSPPGSDVEKIILIGWCPDSAPMKTRASFAANFGTVANKVLKGYHVQVTARDEDDLNENEILMKVSNAAGARYSIQSTGISTSKPRTLPKKTQSPPPPQAASSIPATKKFESTSLPNRNNNNNNNSNNNNSNNDDDWGEPEVKERDFDKTPLKPSESAYKPIGKVDLQKVIAEENAKEDPRLVNSTPSSNKINPSDEINNLKQQSKSQRDQEMNAYLGTKPPLSTDNYKTDNDKVIKGFTNEKSPAQLWAEKKAANNKDSGITDESLSSPRNTTSYNVNANDNEEAEEPAVNDLKSKFEKLSASNDEPQVISPKPFSKQPAPIDEFSSNKNTKQFGTPLPGMQDNNDFKKSSKNDDEWDDREEEAPAPGLSSRSRPEEEDAPAPGLPSRSRPEEEDAPAPGLPSRSRPEEEDAPSLPNRGNTEQQESEPVPSLPSRENATEEPSKPAGGATAIAQYDYEAAEDNELTFNENDKIINIEFVDDDWWLGELESSGEKGLFPSNYVELEN
ncbi:hypothetical protein TBLA_0F00280 [Henningerozyma blattae CBS 6284]|uniref:Actin-binding protein n=1 Tax=Henningerozyma blattae (strain ATCC 34711 / CBS 6284 / DSM 70876 / NBRC 10599 / NRRL Y-10934 / UCD 77-7) TaxID=1071380 RepID=I2H5C0_HENB6|nr:hypothetical protein TBLA_0F00280 [Tetrapisispora blattae CBS 6284]CCH61572.1 hypothetical protein TBLA_0F00280 [Tetrapisispora blattae CBS 6284]